MVWWMENTVLPCMPVWYIYIYIYVCAPYIHLESRHGTEDFTDLTREMVVSAIDRQIRDEDNGCRFEGQRKETRTYMRHAWLIAVRERMLEFYLD